ncbi:MAG: ABC transporter permease, partial [Pseudomonadota bacterium]|nr:ABC transporter permease [Pseudomonadota bacterium]
MLRLFPAITVIVLLLPVLAGLIGTVAPGFGYFPAVGGTTLSVQPFRDLFDWAGFMPALSLSLRTGLIATAASLIITMVLLAGWHGTRAFRWVERVLSPLLSAPHAAAAFGIAFLIAPSGWIVRALSPWATGWERPPDLLIVQDPGGWAMIAGLVAKEVPFLMLMSLVALPQTAPEHSLRITAALGYGRVAGWFKAIFPRLYARIRLPVYAVLAYSLSVVDVAIILGPNTPPPLAVQVVKWMGDPDLSMRLVASAGAVVQLVLVIGVLCLWRLMELLV